MSREQQISAAARAIARYFGNLEPADAAEAMIEAFEDVFAPKGDDAEAEEAYDEGVDVLYEYAKPGDEDEDE